MKPINLGVVKKIKELVLARYEGNKASAVLRKTSLFISLSRIMGCYPRITFDCDHDCSNLFTIQVKMWNFDSGNVKLKDVIVWKSKYPVPYEDALDEALNAFRCKNAHFAYFTFHGGFGTCDIKLDVPYYETNDELQMQCVLAGKWIDIETI